MAAHQILPSQPQPPNIWTQMSYTPPRGSCQQKSSLLQTCACFRFMVHPLKAASSFDCDGCGHHACFHRMENPADDAAALRRHLRHEEEEEERGGGRGNEDPGMRKGLRQRGTGADSDDRQETPKRRRITADPKAGRDRDVVTVDLSGGDQSSSRAQEVPESGKKQRMKLPWT